MCAVSRAPFAKLSAYRQRRDGASPGRFGSSGCDFNFDFGVAHTKEAWESGLTALHFGEQDLRPAARTRTPWSLLRVARRHERGDLRRGGRV